MTSSNKTEPEAVIRPRAGLMRGARLWPDPDGILVSPFLEDGQQMAYVYVYGEEAPAVFDGVTWHPILTGDLDWYGMQDDIANQYYKIIEQAKTNPNYSELAKHISGGAL